MSYATSYYPGYMPADPILGRAYQPFDASPRVAHTPPVSPPMSDSYDSPVSDMSAEALDAFIETTFWDDYANSAYLASPPNAGSSEFSTASYYASGPELPALFAPLTEQATVSQSCVSTGTQARCSPVAHSPLQLTAQTPALPLQPSSQAFSAANSPSGPVTCSPTRTVVDTQATASQNVQLIPTLDLSKLSKAERKKIRENTRNLTCHNCGTNRTPLWRRTPDRAHSLCNACGLYYKQYQTHRPANVRSRAHSSLQIPVVAGVNGTSYAVLTGANTLSASTSVQLLPVSASAAESITLTPAPSVSSLNAASTQRSLKRPRDPETSFESRGAAPPAPIPSTFNLFGTPVPVADIGGGLDIFRHSLKDMPSELAHALLTTLENQVQVLKEHLSEVGATRVSGMRGLGVSAC